MLTTTSWHSWEIYLAAKPEREDLIRCYCQFSSDPWGLFGCCLCWPDLAWHSSSILSPAIWEAPSRQIEWSRKLHFLRGHCLVLQPLINQPYELLKTQILLHKEKQVKSSSGSNLAIIQWERWAKLLNKKKSKNREKVKVRDNLLTVGDIWECYGNFQFPTL